MTRTILVPLDGSPVAERILAYIPALRTEEREELLLVSVLEAGRYAAAMGPDSLLTFDLADWRREAEAYLKRIAGELREMGMPVQTRVLEGDVAAAICDIAAQQADLIAMTTHGRSGVKLWLLGSIADRVVRTAQQPVLLVRPDTDGGGKAFRRLLVPLDGSSLAEAALGPALDLARPSQGELLLMQVVEALDSRVAAHAEMDTPPPSLSTAEQEAAAQAYLDGVADGLRREGVAVRTLVTVGYAPEAIPEVAAAEKVDLVVMSTHGRSGLSRWVFGSVAEKVVRLAACPVLLIRARTKAANQQPLGANPEPAAPVWSS
jgi:nucleotide-binding universal stress UspA family protein